MRGPFAARTQDIPELNELFSAAFTERYRRDGMSGVRVPFLNPAVWRYAIDDADAGALYWRGARDEIAAFNMIHQSGTEGWMGPLAVREDYQGGGAGKEIVRTGIAWLRQRGSVVIGLETMPRTMDNIGFYSTLGFVPGHLTLTMTLDAKVNPQSHALIGRCSATEKARVFGECRALLNGLCRGYDYTRELTLTDDLALGDTVLLHEGTRLVGFALCHTAPLVEGRPADELRVLKLVLEGEPGIDPMLNALRAFASRSGARRVAIRIQGEYTQMYRRLIALGARVRWSDLRMSLAGHEEQTPVRGVVLSNWEI